MWQSILSSCFGSDPGYAVATVGCHISEIKWPVSESISPASARASFPSEAHPSADPIRLTTETTPLAIFSARPFTASRYSPATSHIDLASCLRFSSSASACACASRVSTSWRDNAVAAARAARLLLIRVSPEPVRIYPSIFGGKRLLAMSSQALLIFSPAPLSNIVAPTTVPTSNTALHPSVATVAPVASATTASAAKSITALMANSSALPTRSARKDVCSSASPSLAAQNASPIPHSLCYCPVAVFSGSNLKRRFFLISAQRPLSASVNAVERA